MKNKLKSRPIFTQHSLNQWVHASNNILWRVETCILLIAPQCERECVHLRPCLSKAVFSPDYLSPFYEKGENIRTFVTHYFLTPYLALFRKKILINHIAGSSEQTERNSCSDSDLMCMGSWKYVILIT